MPYPSLFIQVIKFNIFIFMLLFYAQTNGSNVTNVTWSAFDTVGLWQVEFAL